MKDYSKDQIKKALANVPTRALLEAAALIKCGAPLLEILEWATAYGSPKRKEFK